MARAQASTGRGGEAPAAVLLDAFATLLALEPPGPRLRRSLRRTAGVEVGTERAAAAFRAEVEHYLAHHLEGRDAPSLERLRSDCAEVVRASLGLPEELAEAVRTALLEAIRFRAHPDVAPALASLRARGARLAVVSNWDCSLDTVLDDAGVGTALDAVVTSAEVGAAKPDPRPFAAALERIGVPAGRAVHVGDSVEHDVAGARSAGVSAILLARQGAPAPTSPGSDVPRIGSLADLPHLLFGW